MKKKQAFDIRRFIPDAQAVKEQVPLAALVLFGVGCLVLFVLVVVPELRAAADLSLTVIDTEQRVAEEEALLVVQKERIRKQIDAAQVKIDNSGDLFLSRSQATEALDRIYGYAATTDVEVVTLQNQPKPEQDNNAAYEVAAFRLRVDGELDDLLRFVGLVKRSIASETFLLSNLQIAPQADTHNLVMDVTFCISAYHAENLVSPMMEVGVPEDSSADSSAETLPSSTATSSADGIPSATPTTSPLLVKPDNWPADWPWPPQRETAEQLGLLPGGEATHTIYVVQPGDSLSSIAQHFGTTVAHLREVNDLASDLIYVNQKLLVPLG